MEVSSNRQTQFRGFTMNTILMRIIIDIAVFLELSGDDIIDPDAAITQLENLAANLQELTEEDLRTFVRFVAEVASTSQDEGEREEVVNFLKSLPSALGLTD
jgi:hypothetical protein